MIRRRDHRRSEGCQPLGFLLRIYEPVVSQRDSTSWSVNILDLHQVFQDVARVEELVGCWKCPAVLGFQSLYCKGDIL